MDFDAFYQYKFRQLAEKLGNKLHIQYLVSSMKYTHQMIKERKSTMLNNYINYCALKIQKVFRGHLARKLDLPLRVFLGAKGQSKLQAVLQGWRVRRIFRLKETKSKIKVIKDHDNLDLSDMDLQQSRSNNCERLIRYVNSMEKGGSWTMYNRDNLRRQPMNRNVSKENKEALIQQIGQAPRGSGSRGNQSRPHQK